MRVFVNKIAKVLPILALALIITGVSSIAGQTRKGKAADYFNSGNEHFGRQEYDLAIADFTRVIELDPKDSDAYSNRGVAYGRKQQYDSAIADYTKAVALNPNDADTYNKRGNAYLNKQEYDPAIADYTTAVKLDPKYSSAYFNRGLVYARQQKYDPAVADYSKAVESNPKNIDAYLERGNIYFGNKQQPDLAFADYAKAVELDPKNSIAYNNLGAVYNDKQQFSLAITNLTKAIELDPKNLLAYINRADSYDAVGNSKLADLDRKKYGELGGNISASGGKQRRNIFPQGTFNSELAKAALGRGSSTIAGKACTKRDGLIFDAADVQVVLYPVTPYLEEWYQLRDKKEDKNTGVFMSKEANKYAIAAVSDADGRFSFEGLKPGKYFIQLIHNFNQLKSQRVYTGSGTTMEGPTQVTTNYYYDQDYTVERSQRLEKFVEINQDGETKKITLAKGLIKTCSF